MNLLGNSCVCSEQTTSTHNFLVAQLNILMPYLNTQETSKVVP